MLLGFENEAGLLEPEIAAILYIHKSEKCSSDNCVVCINYNHSRASITAAPITELLTAEDITEIFTLVTNPQ